MLDYEQGYEQWWHKLLKASIGEGEGRGARHGLNVWACVRAWEGAWLCCLADLQLDCKQWRHKLVKASIGEGEGKGKRHGLDVWAWVGVGAGAGVGAWLCCLGGPVLIY